MLLAIVVIVLIAGILAGAYWYAETNRRRSGELRNRFGTEYDYEIARMGSRRRAEAELAEREKRVERLDIKPLPDTQHQEFADRWRAVQARFVDDPQDAVAEADMLVESVMTARGYPMADWELRSADVSVDHPPVVAHYRAAYGISRSMGAGRGNTELLRQAMMHYRALFDELLMPERVGTRS